MVSNIYKSSSLDDADVHIVISIPLNLSNSVLDSGKIESSLIPNEKLPKLSQPFLLIPLKSLILGNDKYIKLLRKFNIFWDLNVTLQPTIWPSLNLKFEIDFFAFVKIGFWPVIA